MMRRILKALARPILYAHRRQVSNRQAGFAMVLVIVTVAILGAVAGEFGYNARVEFESAANARDQVRAEYLARSGINLSRLLIKVQQAVLDPLRSSPLKLDIQIADFAPFLMQAFGGADGSETLGGLLGISADQIKGLGVGKGASFDVQMGTEDGKINVNCAGGIPNLSGAGAPLTQAQQGQGVNGQAVGANGTTGTNTNQQVITNRPQALYVMLTALMFSPRYNRLFDNPDADGQYATRDLIARGLIDWSDIDETQFDPTGASGNPEDYRYDALRDPYKAHNNYYDTTDEMQLVKGVGDDFWGSFGEMLTVYGGCKVNLNAVKAENWPVTAAIIRAAAKDPNNPALMDDMLLSALAQQIGGMGQMLGGIQNVGDFATASKNGGVLPPPAGLTSMMGGSSGSSSASLVPPIPGAQPVELDPARLAQIATVGPRIVYRLDSTGTIDRTGNNKNGKKVSVHIRAIFDTSHFNQNTTSTDRNDRMGTWVYWRME